MIHWYCTLTKSISGTETKIRAVQILDRSILPSELLFRAALTCALCTRSCLDPTTALIVLGVTSMAGAVVWDKFLSPSSPDSDIEQHAILNLVIAIYKRA